MSSDPTAVPFSAPAAGPLPGGLLPAVFAALPAACLFLTPELRIAAVSDAYLALRRATRAQLLGQPLFDALAGLPTPPAAAAVLHLQAALQQAAATGQPRTLPEPAAPGTAPEQIRQLHITPVFGPDAQLCGFIHTVTEAAPTAPELQNQAGGQASPPETGQPVQEAGVVDVAAQVLARQRAEAQERLTSALNAELQTANQQLRANAAKLEQAQQQLSQLNQELEVLVFERTQALRHAVAATEREREQLYQVFEQTPVAIAIMRGPNLRVELANPAVAAIWGREPAQVLGRPYFEAVPETAGQGLEQLLAGVLTTGRAVTLTEAPVFLDREHTGRPTRAYVNFVFQPLSDADGATVGLVASGSEVTEQVLARRQQEKLNQQLEARVQERTRAAQLAQAEAEAGRATLQHVFEQAPVALCILEGPDHRITLANAEMGLIWGRNPAGLLGRPHFEALPDLAGQGFEAIFADVYQSGQPYYLREMPVSLDRAGTGQLLPGYYHITYQPLYSGQGHTTGIIASAVDVTDQVLARQQIQRVNEELEEQVLLRTHQVQQQSNRLQRLITEAPAAICTLGGPELISELVNARYQALFPDRSLVGRPLLAALPEIADTPVAAILRAVYETGTTFEGQEVMISFARPGDGQLAERYFNFVCQARYDTAGAIDGLVVFAFDVTGQVLSRRRTETLQAAILAAAQRRAQERQDLLNLFEQAPVAVVLLREPDHRLEYYNRQFEQMYPGPVRRGMPIAESYPERVTPSILRHLDGVYQTGTSYQETEFLQVGITPGTQRYVSFTYQAYRENEQIAGVAVFIYDVTAQVLARQQVQVLNEELALLNEELRATNQELHMTNSRLTRTNADLDTFVYTASHDLKVPIANIEGLLDALNRDLLGQSAPDSVPPILHMMKQAVTRFQQTIGHLTEISRLQQEEPAAPETVSLATVVADVQLDLAPLIQTTGAHLEVELGNTPKLPLLPKNLRSIVYNLLSNALKYRSPERPLRIRIGSEQQGPLVVLQVQDNGLGLAEHQQQRLFELFQRLHTHEEGSGVGLYMVRKIAENAGGTVQVRSEVGVGSTFSVTIPLLPA